MWRCALDIEQERLHIADVQKAGIANVVVRIGIMEAAIGLGGELDARRVEEAANAIGQGHGRIRLILDGSHAVGDKVVAHGIAGIVL